MENQEFLVIDNRGDISKPGTTRIFSCSKKEIIEKYKNELNEYCMTNYDTSWYLNFNCSATNGKRIKIDAYVKFIFIENEFVEIYKSYSVNDESRAEFGDFYTTEAGKMAAWVNRKLGITKESARKYAAKDFSTEPVKYHFQQIRYDEIFKEKAKNFLNDFRNLLKEYNFGINGDAYADYEAAAAEINIVSEDLRRSTSFIDVNYSGQTSIAEDSEVVANRC